MTRLIGTTLLWLSAAHAVAAVITFMFFFMPFAGMKQLHVVAVYVVLVAIVVVAAIGGFLYAGSFGYNDGEYVMAYVLTPIAQAPFASIAWGVAYWQSKSRTI